MGILALLALSVYLTLLVGRISLGQHDFLSIGAYVAGMETTLGHWPLAAALLVGMLVGACASVAQL